MNLEQKEKLETITANLDSIIEILFALQLLDLHCQSELNALKISDFLEMPIESLTEIKNQIKDL